MTTAAGVRTGMPEAIAGAPFPTSPAPEDIAACEEALAAGAPPHKALSDLLQSGRARIRAAFEALPMAGVEAGRSLADLQDHVVSTLFAEGLGTFPLPHPTSSERIAVVAVGGYGRGVLAPGSDIDLLFLTPYKRTGWTESMVETVLYGLWDLKQKVGQATRSTDECIRLAKSDMTIRTSLMETRLVCGDRALYDEMHQRLRDELFAGTGPEFAAAKLDERRKRHERVGGTRYMLEPNIKEGKGALRDLHSLFWIGKYLYQVENSADLVDHGVFTGIEHARFRDAERFLWTVRFWLHYLAGRAQEQLSFDKQIEIAREMGYAGDAGLSDVERFMGDYFTIAKEVGDLTRIFCAALEAQQITPNRRKGRGLFGLFGKDDGEDETLRLEHGRLLIGDPAVFRERPIEMLRVFRKAVESNGTIHPVTLKLIRRNLHLLDTLRDDPDAAALFLDMLCDGADPERALRLMNEADVLGRFMPEFGRIVCMMQFNMYHHYTVDEHTIRAVGALARVERGEMTDEMPMISRIVGAPFNRRVLYVAVLLHDIGKGLPEDHSIVGARIAAEICPRLGLSEAETDSVVWLVRHHLLASDTAQKRDLADAKTIRDFAGTMQSRERLNMLCVLTACDIHAVGPGVWNNWKAQLLRTLYTETLAVLTAGHGALSESRRARIDQAKEALRERLGGWDDVWLDGFMERHYPPYWLGLDAAVHEVHARILRDKPEDAPAIDVSGDTDRAVTRLSMAMGDHPGLFSRIAGAISLVGGSIVDARTFTTTDGTALATFWLQDRDGEAYDDPDRLARLQTTILKVLEGDIRPYIALQAREEAALSAPERNFHVEPQVGFDNTASELFTIVEVTGRDRLGLVHDLAHAITNQRLSIFSAVIATYGERAVDTFYVKDMFGLKVTSEARQKTIAVALTEVLKDDRG